MTQGRLQDVLGKEALFFYPDHLRFEAVEKGSYGSSTWLVGVICKWKPPGGGVRFAIFGPRGRAAH